MQDYRQYVSLADKYEAIPSRYILLMHGYSGSGKSVISGQLVEQLGAIRIRSDVERKRLFDYNAKEQTKSPIEGGIYTEEATKKTYDRVTNLTHDLLNSGASVIVDAAHLKRWQRDLLLQTAESQAVPLLIISCYTEYEELKERVTMRSLVNINDKNRDASEATIQVLEQQHLMADKLSNDELDYTITVHTGQPDQISKLVNQIKHHVGI